MTRIIVKDLKTGRESCMNEKSFEQSLKTRTFKDKEKKEQKRYELVKTLAEDETYELNTGEVVAPIEVEEAQAREEASEAEQADLEAKADLEAAQAASGEKKNNSTPNDQEQGVENSQQPVGSNAIQETDEQKLERMIKEEDQSKLGDINQGK